MRTGFKSILVSARRFFLTVAASVLLLIIAAQLCLTAAIALFNAGRMHDFIQGHVTAALAPSGLDLTFERLFYDPVRGFTLYNVALYDADGLSARMDQFSIAVGFAEIAARHLAIDARAGQLELFRMPRTKADAPEEPTRERSAISVPDIFFRSVSLDRLSIEQLAIGDQNAAAPLILSPLLTANLTLADPVRLDARLDLEPRQPVGGIDLPDRIAFGAAFDQRDQSFAVDRLAITASSYTVDGRANGTIAGDGTIYAQIDAAYPDLTALTQGNLKSANAGLSASGTLAHPSLKLDGQIETGALKERGLADVVFSATADDVVSALDADISVETSFKEQPVSVRAALGYVQPLLTIRSLEAAAPGISASGKATVATDTLLADGNIDLSPDDLARYKDLLALDIGGSLTAAVTFAQKDAAQTADASATLNKIVFNDMRLAKGEAAASFDDLKTPWPQTASIKASGLKLADTASLSRASLDLKQTSDAMYALTLTGSGTVVKPLTFKGSANVSNLDRAVPTLDAIDFTTNISRSSVRLAGSFDPDAVDLTISTSGFRGSDLPAALPAAMANLRLDGSVVMSGASAAPSTKADLRITGIEAGNYKGLKLNVEAVHENGELSASMNGRGPGIRTLNASAKLPLAFALYPFSFALDQGGALNGKIDAALNLAALSPLFLQPAQSLSGDVSIRGTMAGTIGAPDVSGAIAITGGAFEDDVNGISIADLTMDGVFTKDSLKISSLRATDGERGTLSGRGAFSFGQTSRTDMSVAMKDFHLPKSDLADGVVDANIAFQDAPQGYAAKGDIVIQRMNVIVPESFQSKIPELNIVERGRAAADEAAAKILSLAIKLRAPERVFVRGWGLDAEFGGTIDIIGDAGTPQLNGTFSSKRGRYEEFGKRFTLARADLRFQGAVPPSPYLDIEATTPADDVTASILLTGPVKSPSIAFSSVPALPQDEVLSRILFNRESSKITPFQAVQLAQTLQRFSGKGGGGLDPLGMLRSATGLDDISVETDDSGETNVGVGKYLTDKVYLEVEKGGADSPGAANIQIEVTPSVNVESEVGQDSQTGGGVFWKRDY